MTGSGYVILCIFEPLFLLNEPHYYYQFIVSLYYPVRCTSPFRCTSPVTCSSPVRCTSPVTCTSPVRCTSPVTCTSPVRCTSPIKCTRPVTCTSLPCFVPSLVEIGPVVLRYFFLISSFHFCYFVIIFPWKMAWPFIWTNLNPHHPRKMKMWKVFWWTDWRRTTGNQMG